MKNQQRKQSGSSRSYFAQNCKKLHDGVNKKLQLLHELPNLSTATISALTTPETISNKFLDFFSQKNVFLLRLVSPFRRQTDDLPSA
jgi:hypothetical protein